MWLLLITPLNSNNCWVLKRIGMYILSAPFGNYGRFKTVVYYTHVKFVAYRTLHSHLPQVFYPINIVWLLTLYNLIKWLIRVKDHRHSSDVRHLPICYVIYTHYVMILAYQTAKPVHQVYFSRGNEVKKIWLNVVYQLFKTSTVE